DRGLARARISGKAHVQGRAFGRQSNLLAQTRHEQQGGYLPDVGLDGFKPCQLTIQSVQDLIEAGSLMSCTDIHEALLEALDGGVAGGIGSNGLHGALAFTATNTSLRSVLSRQVGSGADRVLDAAI